VSPDMSQVWCPQICPTQWLPPVGTLGRRHRLELSMVSPDMPPDMPQICPRYAPGILIV